MPVRGYPSPAALGQYERPRNDPAEVLASTAVPGWGQVREVRRPTWSQNWRSGDAATGQDVWVERHWELRVDEVFPQGSFGAAIVGADSGDLIVGGDAAELRGRLSSRAIIGIGRAQAEGGVWLTLPGVPPEEVAVGDLLVGWGTSAPPGSRRWGAAPEEIAAVLEDEALLLEWTWDIAVPVAVRGSSGAWTAVLGYLPLSVGGHATEDDAIAGLRDKHRTQMANDEYRAGAIALLRRSQRG